MALTLVTLDFWQTLFAESPAGLAAGRALRLQRVGEALAAAGCAATPAAVDAADVRTGAALEARWAGGRSPTPDEQLDLFLEAVAPGLPGRLGAARGAVAAAYEEAVLGHPPEASPGAVEAIETLARRGLLLGIVSNTGRTPGRVLRRLLDRAGVLRRFAALAFSDEVGARKPDPAIFEAVLARTGVPAAGALHVGDDPARDVAGARAAGLRAVHYAPDGRAAASAADGVLRDFRDLPDLVARWS